MGEKMKPPRDMTKLELQKELAICRENYAAMTVRFTRAKEALDAMKVWQRFPEARPLDHILGVILSDGYATVSVAQYYPEEGMWYTLDGKPLHDVYKWYPLPNL